jgi:two-component system, response regulator PdtaR
VGNEQPGPMADTISRIGAGEVLSPIGAAVLLVEEDGLLRMSLSDAFSEAGYRTLEAGDAKQARDLFEAGELIALMVSDVHLTGMSGLALARWATEASPRVKIIMISRAPDVAGDAAKVGYFLQKPFTPERLLSLVHGVLAPGPHLSRSPA